MATPMTKARFLETLRNERMQWEGLLTQVGEARMTEPGVEEQWSVRDMVAHVTWYERWITERILAHLRGEPYAETGLRALDFDTRNARIHDMNCCRSLAEVLAESRDVFMRLLDAVQQLPDEDLLDSSHFIGMPDDWVPWRVIADNSYGHYHWHALSVRDWLRTKV